MRKMLGAVALVVLLASCTSVSFEMSPSAISFMSGSVVVFSMDSMWIGVV